MEYTNSLIKELIREYIHSDRDRRILYDRLVNGLTFDALAGKYEMSPRQLRTIVHRNEGVLFKHIGGDQNA